MRKIQDLLKAGWVFEIWHGEKGYYAIASSPIDADGQAHAGPCGTLQKALQIAMESWNEEDF